MRGPCILGGMGRAAVAAVLPMDRATARLPRGGPHAFATSRRVEAAAGERMTAGQAAAPAPCPPPRPVLVNRIDHVLAARGMEPAVTTEKGTERRTIGQDKEDQDSREESREHEKSRAEVGKGIKAGGGGVISDQSSRQWSVFVLHVQD